MCTEQIVHLPHDLDYCTVMQYLFDEKNSHIDGVDAIFSITLPRVPLLLHKEKRCFGKTVYTMYFMLPRIYDEIYQVLSIESTIQPHRIYWIVENRNVPDPNKNQPIRVMNQYRTYCAFEFHCFHEKPLHALTEIKIRVLARVYRLSRQKELRESLENEEHRWYYEFGPYLLPQRYKITLLDPLDLRFFETDFYGIRRITHRDSLHVLVATKARKDLLYELLFGKFPFETLQLVDNQGYPRVIHLTLFNDGNQ